MGCGVVRIQAKSVHGYRASSRKLPSVVLEGFGQVIKGGLVTTSKIVQVKKSAPSDLSTMRAEAKFEENSKHAIKKTEENFENSENPEEPINEQMDQLLIIENKVIETSQLEIPIQENEHDPEPTPSAQRDPDGPTEKPVFNNMAPVLILGFE